MVESEVAAAGIKQPAILAVMRTVPRHEFVPAEVRRYAYLDMALPIGDAADDLAAVHRGLHDRAARSAADRQGAGDRHRQRLPGGRAQPAGQGGLHDRNRRAAGRAGRADAQAAGVRQRRTPKSATATRAGPSTRRSTRSSSPARPRRCRSRWSSSLREGGGWSIPLGERYQQTLYSLMKQDGKLVVESREPTLFVPMTGQAETLRSASARASR